MAQKPNQTVSAAILSYALKQIQSLKQSLIITNQSLTKQRIRSQQHRAHIKRLTNTISLKNQQIQQLTQEIQKLRQQQVSQNKINQHLKLSFNEVMSKIRSIDVLNEVFIRHEGEYQETEDQAESVSVLMAKVVDRMNEEIKVYTKRMDGLLDNYKEVEEDNEMLRRELERKSFEAESRFEELRKQYGREQQGMLEEKFERMVAPKRFRDKSQISQLLQIVKDLYATTDDLLNYV